jgi:SAM-dependent methyltransferase
MSERPARMAESMTTTRREIARRAVLVLIAAAFGASAYAQTTQQEFKPEVGQPGKDVVWVPTPEVLVEKMLDLARVTAQDVVVDLGSGDGRNVIAAARRGARARGVEFNPDMVALSKRNAAAAGVADKAIFIEGDMFAAEFSDATVLALFLLPDNLRTLRPKFAALKPGTRIVANTFGIDGWEADATETLEGDCASWCKALLYIVPATVRGTWRLPQGTLTLQQQFQKVFGTLRLGERVGPIDQGLMRGDELMFIHEGRRYTGRVSGDKIDGTVTSAGGTETWTATRAN